MKHAMALMALLWLIAPLPSWGIQISCTDTEITVIADEKAVCESVCDAVRIGIKFLASIGLGLHGSLTITVCSEMPENGLHGALGCYDSRNNEIRLLDYETILTASRQSPPAFGVLMQPVMWHSYVIHELAHASAQQKFTPGVPMCTASEYIASVVQLATLPAVDRDKILHNYPGLLGFDGAEEITLAFYMLDPSKFSVNAYLHYSKSGNGPEFIERILHQGLSDQ